jgi:hypothetical protein
MIKSTIDGGSILRPALVALALCAGAAAPAVAQLTEAELFFELNDTDGDLGIHASIDGGPYRTLEIETPNETLLLRVAASGNLARQGLTQLFLESAEPPFDELPPARFFQRFPEGVYEIGAITQEGRELEARARLSHVLAAPVGGVEISGEEAAEDCDSVLPVVQEPVVIDWEPVTRSHPEIGRSGRVAIDRYQLFVEQGDVKFAVDLPPTVTGFEVPEQITAAGGTFKFEIIARTTARNNTAIESCFIVE